MLASIENILTSYESLFLLDGHKALSEAVAFLLHSKKAKTKAEIAKKTNISASTLTAYLSGEKVISKNFVQKLNQMYNIDLFNPLTYKKDKLFEQLLNEEHPQVNAKTYLVMLQHCRKAIEAQQIIIEGLRKTHDGLRKMNTTMYDYLIRHRDAIGRHSLSDHSILQENTIKMNHEEQTQQYG